MKKKEVIELFVRYVILVALGIGNLWVFYFVFTPLTVFPVYWMLYLFGSGVKLLEGNIIFISGIYAEIIPACIAGAAYYLLLILNLSTPMKLNKRAKSIGFLLGVFLILNISRILFFSALAINGVGYFDVAHELVWYFGSTIMLVVVWFVNVWVFNIKSVPIYTDASNLIREIKK